MVLKGKEDGMSSVEDSDATEEMFNRSMLMLMLPAFVLNSRIMIDAFYSAAVEF